MRSGFGDRIVKQDNGKGHVLVESERCRRIWGWDLLDLLEEKGRKAN